MENKLCRAFNVTISVKEDISDECVSFIKNWCRKQTEWCYAVTEREPCKRHLHANIYFKDNRDPKNIRDTLWKKIKSYHPTSIGRHALHIQACPGRKWVDEYLTKYESSEVVFSNLPENLDDLEDFFPDETVQEILKKKSQRDEKTVDVFYAAHEIEYRKYLEEQTFVSSSETAHEYFLWRMCVRKDMRVIADDRRLFQMSKMLHRYTIEENKLTVKEKRHHNEEHTEFDFNKPI